MALLTQSSALPFRLRPLPPLSRACRAIAVQLPPPNFITVHYAYFIGTCLLASVIFWGSSTPPRSISYTDSLFLTVSAMVRLGQLESYGCGKRLIPLLDISGAKYSQSFPDEYMAADHLVRVNNAWVDHLRIVRCTPSQAESIRA